MTAFVPRPTRRRALLNGLALGCSAAASPLLTPITLASAPWDNRFVVVLLRGGMDGLDVVRPLGDTDFAAARQGALADGNSLPLGNGFFGLHPALQPLMPLWEAKELAFAHAVSTPYRDRRSHFDGQDMLEAGTGFGDGSPSARDGWLNRMLQQVPGVTAETAFAIGRGRTMLLEGAAPASSWAPEARLRMSSQAERLLGVMYERDALFHAAAEEAIALAEATANTPELEDMVAEADGMSGSAAANAPRSGARGHVALASFAAARLREETRIAAFSLIGWDTHNRQDTALPRALGRLSDVLLALKAGLGPIWEKTTVVAMTEFGRTVRENGTRGTDHGTGGAMVLAGGAVKGGRVHGHWPGLTEADLYDGRDLMPTEDVRSYAAAAMRGLFGLDRATLEDVVFPGLDMGQVGRVLL